MWIVKDKRLGVRLNTRPAEWNKKSGKRPRLVGRTARRATKGLRHRDFYEIGLPASEADGNLIFALKRAEVVKAIAGRVAVGFAGCGDAVGDHLLGLVGVIGLLFFDLFAGLADRLMVEHGKNAGVLRPQRFLAVTALAGAGEFFFPIGFHVRPPVSIAPMGAWQNDP
jgi:hypothetical protein